MQIGSIFGLGNTGLRFDSQKYNTLNKPYNNAFNILNNSIFMLFFNPEYFLAGLNQTGQHGKPHGSCEKYSIPTDWPTIRQRNDNICHTKYSIPMA